MKKTLTHITKITIAGAILLLVFYHVDPRKIWGYVKDIHPLELILAINFVALAQVASAFRMRFILSRADIALGKRYSVKLGFLGGFFNFLLPGGVGGDAVKIFFIKKHTQHGYLYVLKQLLADRASGLYFLCLLAAMLLAWIQPYLIWWWLKYAIVIAALIVTLVYFATTKILLLQRYETSLAAILYTTVVQCFWVAAVVTLWLAIGDGTHGVEYVLLYALAGIAATIPISIGGLGLREVAFLFGAQFLNAHAGLSINEEMGVAISLALYAVAIVSVLPGVLFWKEVKNHKVMDLDASS